MSASRSAKEPLKGSRELYRLALLLLGDIGVAGLGLESVRLELGGLYKPAAQAKLLEARSPRANLERAAALLLEHPLHAATLVRASEHNRFALVAEYQYFLEEVVSGNLLEPTLNEAPVWAEPSSSVEGRADQKGVSVEAAAVAESGVGQP